MGVVSHEPAIVWQHLISADSLSRLAGSRTFGRGREYVLSGRVGPITVAMDFIEADVTGGDEYHVALGRHDGHLTFSCTCPIGEDGACCKHVVALGLAYAEGRPDSLVETATLVWPRLSEDDVRADLMSRSQHDLVGLLLELSTTHDTVRRRLWTDAAARVEPRINQGPFRLAIDQTVRRGGRHVRYRNAGAYAREVDDVVDSIGRLLERGLALDVMELCEYALFALEGSMADVEDLDGDLSDTLQRLENLHHAACVSGKPEPVSLAERLMDWQLQSEWGIFYHVLPRYADVFGDAGLRAYRKKADALWATVPALGPGDSQTRPAPALRDRITALMRDLAVHDGALETLVSIHARDLTSARTFLRIAELYRNAGRRPEALTWIERGLREFANNPEAEYLQPFAADEYHFHGRHDAAMALIWDRFVAHPLLARYQDLRHRAEPLGQWADWRQRARSLLLERFPAAPRSSTPSKTQWSYAPDQSVLVSIELWEGDTEAAWSTAKTGGCSEGLWLELARQRERDHPYDVLPIYRRQVDAAMASKNNRGYDEAMRWLRDIRRVMTALQDEAGFLRYLETLRATHRAKRNFMTRLAGARWTQ